MSTDSPRYGRRAMVFPAGTPPDPYADPAEAVDGDDGDDGDGDVVDQSHDNGHDGKGLHSVPSPPEDPMRARHRGRAKNRIRTKKAVGRSLDAEDAVGKKHQAGKVVSVAQPHTLTHTHTHTHTHT